MEKVKCLCAGELNFGEPAPDCYYCRGKGWLPLATKPRIPIKPRIVCLCGSTRFMEAFQKVNMEETLAGHIVLSVGCNTKSDTELGVTPEVKLKLDELHLRKIDMCNEVLVLNVDGYIGDSTRREIIYAIRNGKAVRFLEPENGSKWMTEEGSQLGLV